MIAMLLLQGALQAQPGWTVRDDLLEDFEAGFPFGWLAVDAEGSGSTWQIVSRDAGFLTYGDSDFAAGCRYNDDGSQNDDWLITPRLLVPDTSRTISFWAASQDLNPEYLESFEIRVSRTRVDSSNFDPALFDELVATYHNIPSTLVEYAFDTAPDFLGDTIQVAVRCVSQDDYYLIVDHFVGVEIAGDTPPLLYTWPTEEERIDLGPFEVGATVADTVWVGNMGGDTLQVDVSVTLPLITIQESFSLPAWTLESVPFNYVTDHPGIDNRPIVISWVIDGEADYFLSGAKGLSYYPDTSYTWEDFEVQTIPEGWDASHHYATSPGWQVADHSSSMFFSIPAHTWYAYINSDEQGEDATQDDWLISPPLVPDDAEELLYLTWESFFDDYAGGAGRVLWTLDDAPTPDSDWNVIHEESGTDTLWVKEWWRVPDSLWAESIRLGFHFTGQWSQGWAIDDLQLLRDTIVEEVAATAVPAGIMLPPPYPNPFNAELTIPLQLSSPARVRFRLYNLLGQLVWQQEADFRAGRQQLRLRGDHLASGIYFLRCAAVAPGGDRHLPAVHKVVHLK